MQEWVKIAIERHDWGNYSNYKVLKVYDIPRWLFQTDFFKKRIRWIVAKYEYMNYGFNVIVSHAYYDRITNESTGYGSKIQKVISAKQVLSRYKSKLFEFKKSWQPTLMTQTIENDERYVKAIKKIADKEKELENLLSEQ